MRLNASRCSYLSSFLTAYATVISQWCGTRDLLVRFVLHGRHRRPELENVIGYVSHSLYLRIEITPAMTFRDLLAQVRREFAAATEHRDFDRVPNFIPECTSEVAFHWRSASRTSGSSPVVGGQIRVQPFIIRPLNDWPLKFWSVFYDTPGGMGVTMNYRPDCLATSTIRRLGEQLQWVAAALIDRPLEHVGVGSPAQTAALSSRAIGGP